MWITVRQYADKHGVTTQTTQKKMREGKLHGKKDDEGHWQIEVPDEETTAQHEQASAQEEFSKHGYTQSALESRWDVENELKRQKIKNIEADIIIKRQKVQAYRERLRTEFCEGVLEAFTDAFADLKGAVVDLKLRKEQIKKYKDTYSKCLKKFEAGLVKYLKTKDLEEEKEQDDDIRGSD